MAQVSVRRSRVALSIPHSRTIMTVNRTCSSVACSFVNPFFLRFENLLLHLFIDSFSRKRFLAPSPATNSPEHSSLGHNRVPKSRTLSTRIATMGTPESTVLLETAELLEMVLLRLPCKDLLLAQRVCKTWQNAINASPEIQQALCFRPLEDQRVVLDHATSQILPLRPLTHAAYQADKTGIPFVELDDLRPTSTTAHDFFKTAKDDAVIVLNPLLSRLLPRKRRGSPSPSTFIFAPSSHKAATLSSAQSWRRMSLTQPPIQELDISVGVKSESAPKPKDGQPRTCLEPDPLCGLIFSKVPSDCPPGWSVHGTVVRIQQDRSVTLADLLDGMAALNRIRGQGYYGFSMREWTAVNR